jgi:hypothetical protein
VRASLGCEPLDDVVCVGCEPDLQRPVRALLAAPVEDDDAARAAESDESSQAIDQLLRIAKLTGVEDVVAVEKVEHPGKDAESVGPNREGAYLGEVVSRLRALLGRELVGVHVGGSYALGDYRPGRSDLDVTAVTRDPIRRDARAAIVEMLRHESLPCPARGLEFVLYPLAVIEAGTTEPGFELNLNTGRGLPFRADYEPQNERHWFAIDRSVLSQHGVALLGPPAESLFAPVPPERLLPVLADSLRWYEREPGRGDDAVLNACRGLRFAREGVWSSKRAAGAWAHQWLGAPEIVAEAVRAHGQGGSLDPERVRAFLSRAIASLERPR